MRSSVFFTSLIILSVTAYAGDYYVDAENGSDATGDGSAGNPWKTINYAFSQVNAYDGDGVDTLNLSGTFYEEGTATAQSDDDGITITGGVLGLYEEEGGITLTLDVTNVDDVNISENEPGGVNIQCGDGTYIYNNTYDPEEGYGHALSIYAFNKDDVTIKWNVGWGGLLDFSTTLDISITGGAGHYVDHNSAATVDIYVYGVASGEISYNHGREYLGQPGVDCYIGCYDSPVSIHNNMGRFGIHGAAVPVFYDNNIRATDNTGLDIDTDNVQPLGIENNSILGGANCEIDMSESSLCRFIGTEFGFVYFGYYYGSTVYLTGGQLLVEDCMIEEWEIDNSEDYFVINGGVADLGGGPLGSAGNNDFSNDDWNSYFIKNNTSDDVYALNNTWDAATENEMDGHYYDTYNVTRFYDKWEDPSNGFVIWSGLDPDGPVPVFNLLSPENGEVVDTLTPTVDWEDISCPWVDFDHFDLYVDTDPAFGNPDVYGGLTGSEHTFSDPLDDGVTYYWKVLAFDDEGNDRWSEQTDWSFTVNVESLGDFSLLSPGQGETVYTLTPTLDWEDSVPGYSVRGLDYSVPIGVGVSYSRDSGRACELDHYDVWLDTNPDYTDPLIYTDITDSTYVFTDGLDDQTTYYWKVVAVDNLDREKWCIELDWWFHVDEAGHLSDFSLLSPVKGETVTTLTPTLDWDDSIPEYDGGRSTLAIIERAAVFRQAGVYTSRKVPRNGEDRLCELDHYDVWLDTNPDYNDPLIYTDITDSTYVFTDGLDDQTTYYWKVVAVDNLDREKWCIELDWWFKTDTTLNIVPASFGRIKASFTDGATATYSTGESESRMNQ